jgi:hypothetical protein
MADAKSPKSLRDEYPGAVPLTSEGETFKWDKPGLTLRGKFLRLRAGSMGGDMVMLDTPTGAITASAPKTLADALDGVRQGTEVVIRYTGEEVGQRGQKYKRFEVVALS